MPIFNQPAPAPMPAPILQAYANDPRQALAAELIAKGTASTPVWNNTQGFARLATALLGGYQKGQVRREYEGQADAYRKAQAEALAALQSGDRAGAAKAAQGNQYLAESLGLPLALSGIEHEQKKEIAGIQAGGDLYKTLLTSELANYHTTGDPSGLEKVLAMGSQLSSPAQPAPNARVAGGLETPSVATPTIAPQQTVAEQPGSMQTLFPQKKAKAQIESEAKVAADRAAAKPKLVGAIQGSIDTMGKVNAMIDKASANVGPLTAGPAAVVTQFAGKGRTLSNEIKAIKANIGFDGLQEMRDNSPTGGALGQVAVQELDYLQSTLGRLDQLEDPAEVRATLEEIRTHLNKRPERIRQAYVRDYGEEPPVEWKLGGAEESAAPAAEGPDEEMMKKAQAMGLTFDPEATAKLSGTAPAAAATATPSAPATAGPMKDKYGRDVTEEDIQHTAKLHGKTPEEVRQMLGL